MIDLSDEYPHTIIDIRRNFGLEWDDASKDDKIQAMSRAEKFKRFMTWNGIIGYDGSIKCAIKEIYHVELDEGGE